jgi:hypothetical protein
MDYHDDDEFDDDDEFETRIRNLAHPQNVGLLEKRICNLEKRIEALNHKLDNKTDVGHSHMFMNSAIYQLQDEWILFRLIREIIGIVLILGIIAIIIFWLS